MSLCLCGCGGEAKPGRKYIRYHYKRSKNQNALQSLSAGNFPMPFQDPPPTPGTPDTMSYNPVRPEEVGDHFGEGGSTPPADTSHSSIRMQDAGGISAIPELKGIDTEIFLKNLNRELTEDEAAEVRKWALNSSIRMRGAGQRNDTSVPAPITNPISISGTAFSMFTMFVVFMAAGSIQFVNFFTKYSASDMKWSGALYLGFAFVFVLMYFRSRKSEKTNPNKFPGKLLSTDEIRELQIKQQEENLTDEQKYLRFFGSLPKWVDQKPGALQLKLAKWKTGNEFDMKLCVFVDEDKGDHRQVYLPYNSDIGVLFTDNGFYDMPIGTAEPIFLDKSRFAPLVNRKNYRDDFDIPEDFAASLVNIGIGYGRLSQFKDLIAEIKKLTTTQWLAFMTVLAIIVFMVYFVYSTNKHYDILANQVGNLTAVIKSRGG